MTIHNMYTCSIIAKLTKTNENRKKLDNSKIKIK